MAQMPFAEHNNMIETIPSDRTNEPLRVSILPWRPWRDRPIPNTKCSKPLDDDIAIDAIPIANDISWRLLPAVGFGQLTQSNGRSDVRSRPATEARGGNAVRSQIHTTAETRSSGLRTNPSRNATPVIGFLASESQDGYADRLGGYRQGLKESGYTEGENVAIEYSWANVIDARATELVRHYSAAATIHSSLFLYM
jgi:hypothetical protein